MNFHVSLTLQFLLVLMALFTYRAAVRFYCQKGDKLSTRTLKFLDDLLPLDSKNKAAIVLLLVLVDILIIKTFPLSTLLLMYTFCLVYFAKELCRDVLPSLHETVVAWGDYVTTILDTLLEVTVEGFVWWVVVFPLDQCFGVFFKFFLTMILGYRVRTRIDRMDASPLLGNLTLGRIARTGCLLVFFLDPLYSLHASLSAYIVNEGLVQVLPQRYESWRS
ncbi:hypothetical protein BGX29_004265 [Mortierella sp. GBA35]|nr:hypothetical protein BGX29_004265 [Mortierella sp. GBA35]